MNSQNKSASQIEKLHILASLSQADLEARYCEDLTRWLAEFVVEELYDVVLPPVNSPQAFADAVLELGRNKKSWSNRLACLVIDLSGSQAAGDKEHALKQLDEFAELCPWKFLRESACKRI